MTDLDIIKKFWDSILVDRKITKTFYDDVSLTGFMLNDGVKVEYDHKTKGLYVISDPTTHTPVVHH